MKVLLVTLEYPPMIGGVSTYLHELYGVNSPHEVTVISPETHRMSVWWMWPRWYPFYRELCRIVSEQKPDEIHVSHVLPIGLMAFWIKRKFGIPYTIIYHGLDLQKAHEQPNKWKRVSQIAESAQRTIVNSHATLQLVKEWLPHVSNVSIVQPGAPRHQDIKVAGLDELRRTHDLQTTRVILFLGRLVARKGVFLAIDAYHALLKKNIEATLVIVGDGPERQKAENYARELGLLGTRIKFIGRVSDEEKWKWYAISHLLWFPAIPQEHDMEGYGIVSLEAQASGCPVIVSAVGGLPETVVNNVSGMVVDPTAEAFVEASEYILLDSDVWQRMRSSARAHAEKNTWELRRDLFTSICE